MAAGPVPQGEDLPAAREVLAALPVAVLLVDGKDRVRGANGSAETLLNRSQGAMAGRPLDGLLDLPEPLRPVVGTPRDGALAAFDVTLTLPGGAIRADLLQAPLPESPGWRLLTLHPLASPLRRGHDGDGGGGALTAVGAAAILAHEVRNPLSGIRGAAQLLADGPGIDDDGRSLTRLIIAEVDRIAALIDGLQGFGDDRELPLATVNIYPMLDHAMRVATAGFGRDVQFTAAYDPSLPPVSVNPAAFVQVMINLLKNACAAVAATPAPQVTVATAFRPGVALSPGGGRPRRSLPIEIMVTDNGPGAPAAIADHLFDPFVSGGGGQGLGLTLVDKLMRDMGGMVRYAREGQPERTVFRLRLGRGA